MDKIMEAIIEINTKGSLQEQAKKLYNEECIYKLAISQYNKQIENRQMEKTYDAQAIGYLTLFRNKYQIRLDFIKKEMCLLNRRIIDTLNVIEEFVDWKTFIEVFELIESADEDDNEVDREEDYYNNLIFSSNYIGHVVRTGLIQNEKMAKEMFNDVNN
ncbi:hypothetical protein [Clostridium sp. FP1]|uniref:hypothetical protein n=1 Tax=Clostridium sp. FP1 TaxID=2724076 RepID=UPI0013E96D28|nr:hypothetical protein [Clostridium sp. FP1]MBZ9635520.1 hypothetical protein [Clostridium sp. FP1]